MLICLFWCSCDAQDVLKPTQIEILSAEATVISPVPDFIFTDVMKKKTVGCWKHGDRFPLGFAMSLIDMRV